MLSSVLDITFELINWIVMIGNQIGYMIGL